MEADCVTNLSHKREVLSSICVCVVVNYLNTCLHGTAVGESLQQPASSN